MASAGAKATRRADALQRLSRTLGHKSADLHAHAKGDPEMALIMTLERVADKVDELKKSTDKRITALEEQIAGAGGAAQDAAAPLTVETVEEKPPKTTETVEIVQDGSKTVIGDKSKPTQKGSKDEK